MYEAYSIAILVIFIFLSVIWSKDGWTNAAIKVLFILMALWSCLEVTDRLNYLDAYGRKDGHQSQESEDLQRSGSKDLPGKITTR